MGAAERRDRIIRYLSRNRFASVQNLADEFEVSTRTIQRDIEAISLNIPIYTKTGRYEGGVYVVDGYYVNNMYMTKQETDVLKKLLDYSKEHCVLLPEEIEILDELIILYSNPNFWKECNYENRRKRII